MALLNDVLLAPKGSTGNNTHATAGNFREAGLIAFEFTVEAVGATPAVTAQLQGSLDGVNWTNLALLTPDATVATSTTALTVNAVGNTQRFVDGLDKRFFEYLRVVTSANTNVTYSARVYIQRGSRGV